MRPFCLCQRENRSVMAEYCYQCDVWRTIGYFSATAGLHVQH